MKKHPIDPWSFFFGVLIAGIGIVFLASDIFIARPQIILNTIGIGGPLLAVVAGLALMAPVFRRRSEDKDESTGPVAPDMTDELPPSPL